MSELDTLRALPGISDLTLAVVAQVREFLRDLPELNRLVKGYESSDRQILWALVDAVSLFNANPPATSYSLDALVQKNYLPILIRMTCITLLESIGLLQTRNHVNYSNGGLNLGANDKTPLIQYWLKYFRSIVDQMLQRYKTADNILSIMGPGEYGVPSQYWALHTSYSSWGSL